MLYESSESEVPTLKTESSYEDQWKSFSEKNGTGVYSGIKHTDNYRCHLEEIITDEFIRSFFACLIKFFHATKIRDFPQSGS